MGDHSDDLLDARMVQRKARNLARQLGQEDFTVATTPQGDGSPYVEVANAYYFVVEERGLELERRRAADLDELLYWILEGLTSSLAWDYEMRHRREGEDVRRQGFAKQIEFISILSPEWGKRLRAEQAEILARYPFSDD
ncbi:hypothetical protein CAP39_00755 [Sphingomonas sp. IBVSS1]|nr:hypothetical protein CAP39_00755 [Sphingomonas sp. IBVSS1]